MVVLRKCDDEEESHVVVGNFEEVRNLRNVQEDHVEIVSHDREGDVKEIEALQCDDEAGNDDFRVHHKSCVGVLADSDDYDDDSAYVMNLF